MKKSRLAIALGSLFTITLVGTLGLSLAWFTTARFVDFDNLSGSVLTSYFDKVDYEGASAYEYGSEQNPFVITRPKHWENLAKLHYAMPGFSGNDTENPKEYYFEIGKQIGGTGDYVVYNYDDEGKAQQDQKTSRTLNLNAIDILPPLGSTANPFSNHIKGNSITIKNFTVGGEGYGDLGIFGYVGERGTCSNLYFSSFTIDVSKASPMAVSDLHADHASGQEDHGYFGFLCGHLYDSKNFTNVYVNSCTLKGELDSTTSNITDRYGYYGHVNLDSLGGQSGNGSNYEFTLSADATHQYMTSAYSSLLGQDLYTRKTEEAAKSTSSSRKPVLRDGYTAEYKSENNTYYFYTVGPDGEKADAVTEKDAVQYWEAPVMSSGTNVQFSNDVIAYTVNDPIFQTTTYTLMGNSPQSSGSTRNYSLSTLGTYGNPSYFTKKHFELVYMDAGGNYQQIPEMMRLVSNDSYNPDLPEGSDNPEFITVGTVEVRGETTIDDLYNSLVELKQSSDPTATQVSGEYIYFDSTESQWKYVQLNLGVNGGSGTDIKRKLTIVFPQSNSYTHSWAFFGVTFSLKKLKLELYLTDTETKTFADSSVSTSDLSDYYYASNTRFQTTTTIYSKEMSFDIPNIAPGKYTLSAKLRIELYSTATAVNASTYYIEVGYGESVTGTSPTMDVAPQEVTVGNFADTTFTFNAAVINGNFNTDDLSTTCTPTAYETDPTLITAKEGHESFGIYGREIVQGEEGDDYDYRYAQINDSSNLYSPLSSSSSTISFGDYKMASISISSGGDIQINSITTKTNSWVAEANDYFPDTSQTITSYIADPAYNSDDPPVDTNPITLSGYKAANMDLVGGDVDFFSWEGINVIAIPGQTSNASTNPIKVPSTYEKFYSTKQTPSSIVLYIKNTSNATDDFNDTLGTIDFQYVTVSLGSWTIFRTSEPMFVKGGSKENNIQLASNFGTKEKMSTFVYHVNVDNLTEFGTMAASYCALDKYGNIIGRFEGGTNSLTSRPAFTNFTSMSEEEALRAIDTYVLVLGCKDDTNYGTWITKVDFSYKAEDGYGGTFGSVEYRDAEDKADNTIFNFYLTYPAGVQSSFEVQVQYVADTDDSTDLLGTYTLTISTTTEVKLTCFLYYSNYTLNIVQNGTILQTATSPGSTSVTISP